MLDIKITRTTSPKEKPQDETKLGFGKKFTDHMFVMDYTEGEGWHDARIVPYAPFPLDPATVVFHYAQEIFEGMKAYRTADDTIQLFRPDCNAKRFQDSADRLCIPKIPEEDFVQAVEALVDVERDWVPHTDGASLYIRPFIFANDVGLGVHASKHYIFCIICAPSGAYYAEGINPVRIYVEDEYIRAAPGLTGFTKCGGNYAASIKAGELAEEQGYAQVLWLDGVEKKYVEEVGSMNIMFKIDGKVYTAATVGTVLPGVTRRSCIELLKDWGYEVIEGKLAIADIMQAARDGKLEEVFGTGTAAVISPVGELRYEGDVAHINNGEIGCMVLGSWAYPQMEAAGENGADIGYMPFPITVNGEQYASAGADYSYGINANATDDEKAAAMVFVKWMTEKSGFSYNEDGLPVAASSTDTKLSFDGVTFLEDEPALEGEEDFLNEMNAESELNINAGGDSKIQAIIEHASNGDKTFDEIMDEWNTAWSDAQESNGIEVTE